MNAKQTALEIHDQLRALGSGTRQGHRPSAQSDFGVYTADLRMVVKEFSKRLNTSPGELVYHLARSLISLKNTECRQVAYELIRNHPECLAFLDVGKVEKLGAGMDNWCCVDNFCTSVAGIAWLKGRLDDEDILRWSHSESLWWRRAALVSTVSLNIKSRGGHGDVGRTLMVCRELADDPEIMVQKALSGALRELIPWDRRAVEEFLRSHPNLPSRVQREVRRKLDTGKKN